MDIAVLGIDLGKTVCSLAGLDGTGAVVFRRRIQRFRLLDYLADLAPCAVAMEACDGAHHIGRFCLEHGHEPRLMPPLYVRPYLKVHKTDDRDAEAIAEAATRLDLYRFCAGHPSHYATLASNASGLIPPRYEWRRRVL